MLLLEWVKKEAGKFFDSFKKILESFFERVDEQTFKLDWQEMYFGGLTSPFYLKD